MSPKNRQTGPKKGVTLGTYRNTDNARIATFHLRDDLRAIAKGKAESEGRTLRNVFECALYYYCGGENLPIPHPDDPQFADRNRKRLKSPDRDKHEHTGTTHLDQANR